MKHNAKRVLSIVLALLMCLSMLTGIVLPASAADTSTEDAYAKINATTVDGKLMPADNVYFIDNKIDNENEPAKGDVVTYTYGDGKTWGDGKTYTLSYDENIFGSWADAKALMLELSAAWAADPTNEKGEAVFVFAPGGYGTSTATTSLSTPAADPNNPTHEELFDVYILGPQAGKSPVNPDRSTKEKALQVQNGRGNMDNEFAFESTIWLPGNCDSYIDGIAGHKGAKFYVGNNFANVTLKNVYYTSTSGSSPSGNQVIALGSNTINVIAHLDNCYFNYEHEFADEASQSLQGNDILVENCVFAKGKMSTKHAGNKPHQINIYPNNQTDASTNFYGDKAAAPSLIFRNNAVPGWESCRFLYYNFAHATYTSYSDYAIDLQVVDNNFFDVGSYAAASDVIRTENITSAAMATSHKLTIEGNLFSFSKEWDTIKGSKEGWVLYGSQFMKDYLENIEGAAVSHTSSAYKWTVTKNTFIMNPKAGHMPFRRVVKAIDTSGNLHLDTDNNVIPSRANGSGYQASYTQSAYPHSDVYASDEWNGGIRELFTVREVENGVACYSFIQLGVRGNKTTPSYFDGVVTVLLKRNDDGTPIEYNADTLLKFNDPDVKFEGLFKEEACTTPVKTVTQDTVDGVYAKATYTAGNTKATVIYMLTVPSRYLIVDPDGRYGETGYKFNGITYMPGQTASDGVTVPAAKKRGDGKTGFFQYIDNSHSDVSGTNTDYCAYGNTTNPNTSDFRNNATNTQKFNGLKDIIVLTPGTYTFSNQGMGKSVCFVGPNFATSPFDNDLAKEGKLANGRSADPANEAVLNGTLNPTGDSSLNYIFDGIAFACTDGKKAINATANGNLVDSQWQTIVIKNCVFADSSAQIINVGNDKEAGKVQKDVTIKDCVFDATGVSRAGSDALINARSNMFTMKNVAVINDNSGKIANTENRLVYLAWTHPKYIKVQHKRDFADFENVVLYNSNRNIVLFALRNTATWDASYEYYPNGAELNIKNCTAIGGQGYFFGAQSPQPKTCGDDDFITLTATGNYFNRTSGRIIQNYQDGGNDDVKCYTDESVFADNEIYLPNGNDKFSCYVGQTPGLAVDNNFFGTTPGSDRIVVLNTATGSGYSKNNIYYVDAAMTKSVDISKFDLLEGDFNNIELVNTGSTANFSATLDAESNRTYDIANAFEANGGEIGEVTLISGNGKLEGSKYTPAHGDKLSVSVTADDYTINWTVTVSADVWAKNGLKDGDKIIDATTQDKIKALTGRTGNAIFIAPDWSKYAYQDEELTTLVSADSSKWETAIEDNQKTDTTSDENAGNYIEMLSGTVFYAKMPTTNVVYKLTYGVTAANLYNANTSMASTIIAFPGTYGTLTSYGAGTLYYDQGRAAGNLGIGHPTSGNFSNILFLGPQAGVSAADVENGTANGRTADPAKEAIFTGAFYIMNGIMGEGDELVIDGIAISNAVFGTYQGENASNMVLANNNATFTFKNLLADGYTNIPFKLYGPTMKHNKTDTENRTNSVGNVIEKNLGKMNLTVNIESSYFDKAANKGWLLGQMQVNQIHIDNTVLKDTKSTNDQSMFYINPNTAKNNPNKLNLSYTCEDSYLELPYSYLFGLYVNGQDLNSTNRDGVEILVSNNKLVDCFTTHNGTDRGRGSMITSYDYTNGMAEMTELTITNNTITTTKEITKTTGGAMVNMDIKAPLKKVDISGNVFIGYGAKYTLNKGLTADVDITNNVFYDLKGNPIAPIVEKIGYTDVNLNDELTAKISDYNIASGADQARFTWANNGTDIYAQIAPQAQATLAYAEGMTLDSIKAGITFESDNVTVKSLTGDVKIGGTLTMVATHALNDKDITFKIGLTGDIAGATDLNDTVYANRDYFDPSVAAMADGTPVARDVLLDGELKSVQFTVGENIFGSATAIPVINKQRDIYLLPIEYAGIGFGATDERNVMNYLHGAQEGVTGVVDNDKDGVPDVKNPARADLNKETVINGEVSMGYHAEVTIDGVTMGAKFRMTNSSGDWGAELATTNMKLINSVSNSDALLETTNYIFFTGDHTHRINVIVENSEIALTAASTGKVFLIRNTNQLTLNNNIIDAGDAGDTTNAKKTAVLEYHLLGKGKDVTTATEANVDITGNLIRGDLGFNDLGNKTPMPIDFNIKNNRFEHNNNTSTINIPDLNGIDVANSKIVFDGNTFTTVPKMTFGNYMWLSESTGTDNFTMVLKNNTFIKTSNSGANYALAFMGGYTLDASENNVFEGFRYNRAYHEHGPYSQVSRSQDGFAIPMLSNGDKNSYMVINGVKYAANHVSDTFTVADLFSDKAVVDTANKTVKEYVNPTAKNYMLSTGDGMMAIATIDGTTYYNAFPITVGGTTTATVQLTKINGETVGDVYTVTFVPACDHSACYKDVEPDEKVDATCVDGYAEYTCPLNGDKFTITLKGDGKHDFSIEVDGTKVEPTCSAAGSVTMKCANCDATEVKTIDIDPDAHVWNTEYTEDIPATCYTEGSESIHCSLCTATKDSKAIPATGVHVAANEWTQGEETHYHACTTNGCTAKPDEADHIESEVIEVVAPQAGVPGVGKIVCTVCDKVLDDNVKIDALPVPTAGGANIGDKNYESLEAALADAKENDVITLNENAELDLLMLDSKITLDLNGKTLTADYVIGFKDSVIGGEGKLIVAKDKALLDKSNGGLLPVYDGNGYIFTSVNLENRTALIQDKLYAFSPVFDVFSHDALAKGYEASNVKIVIRLSWESAGNYRATQDFIYMDSMVENVIKSYNAPGYENNYGRAFSATFSGTEAGKVENVRVSAVIISDAGVEIESNTTLFGMEAPE